VLAGAYARSSAATNWRTCSRRSAYRATDRLEVELSGRGATVLVGFMGAGKSAAARCASQELEGQRALDADKIHTERKPQDDR